MKTLMTDRQLDRAYAVSAQIGAAIRDARRASGKTMNETVRACRSHRNTFYKIERGGSPNLRIGHALKLLEHFGLTLTVTPISDRRDQ